jgi:hypothetical protein
MKTVTDPNAYSDGMPSGRMTSLLIRSPDMITMQNLVADRPPKQTAADRP